MDLPLVTPQLGKLVEGLAADVTLESDLVVYTLLVPSDAVRLREELATYIALVLLRSSETRFPRPQLGILIVKTYQLKHNETNFTIKQHVMQQ